MAAAAVLAVPFVVACNALVGLDDFQRVDCTGGRCDGGAGDVVQPDVVVDGNKPDVIVIADAGGSPPVSWAQWRMPNYVPTGADAGTVDNAMSFGVADGGGVADAITGLVWLESPKTGEVTFAEAKAHCASITAGGSWRVPTRIELVTLLDLSQTSGAKVPEALSKMEARAYWTSSPVRAVGNLAPSPSYWTVSFTGDAVLGKAAESGGKAGVQCIRAL